MDRPIKFGDIFGFFLTDLGSGLSKPEVTFGHLEASLYVSRKSHLAPSAKRVVPGGQKGPISDPFLDPFLTPFGPFPAWGKGTFGRTAQEGCQK